MNVYHHLDDVCVEVNKGREIYELFVFSLTLLYCWSIDHSQNKNNVLVCVTVFPILSILSEQDDSRDVLAPAHC